MAVPAASSHVHGEPLLSLGPRGGKDVIVPLSWLLRSRARGKLHNSRAEQVGPCRYASDLVGYGSITPAQVVSLWSGR
jgi:hypothetical protein